MENYITRALSTDSWDAFERLVEKHNGVWGGCWCTWFHAKPPDHERGAEANRCLKKKLVEGGNAHAALVFDGNSCVAWCQFGTPTELPNIYHKREVEAKMAMPDWRITCIFVDKDHRRMGLAGFALAGALKLIGDLGGGVVESYPQDVQGKKVSSSFLYNGTRQVFEKCGFKYEGRKGKNHCIMRKVI